MRKIKGFTLEHSVNSGFTLVELLIVIGVVGILSAGIVSLIGRAPQQAARDARRFSDLNKIASALELYRTDHSGYPLTGQYPGVLMGAAPNNYISANPTDPSTGLVYSLYTGNGTCGASGCSKYTLCSASFERQTVGVNGCTSGGPPYTCCVTSP